MTRRFLLDTHVAIAFLKQTFERDFPGLKTLLAAPDVESFVSVASLWEIAIKSRLGKLEIGMPIDEMPDGLRASAISILTIEVAHVLTAALPEPPTRDPFDRLLLAQCQVEDLRLVTIDRALADHPLAFRF